MVDKQYSQPKTNVLISDRSFLCLPIGSAAVIFALRDARRTYGLSDWIGANRHFIFMILWKYFVYQSQRISMFVCSFCSFTTISSFIRLLRFISVFCSVRLGAIMWVAATVSLLFYFTGKYAHSLSAGPECLDVESEKKNSVHVICRLEWIYLSDWWGSSSMNVCCCFSFDRR